MGAWFPKELGGEYSNPWANGKNPNVKGKTHQDVTVPILSSCANHLFLPKLVELVNSWGWEEYGNPNLKWRSHQILENVFWLLGQVKTQKWLPILLCIHVLLFLTFFGAPVHFPIHWTIPKHIFPSRGMRKRPQKHEGKSPRAPTTWERGTYGWIMGWACIS